MNIGSGSQHLMIDMITFCEETKTWEFQRFTAILNFSWAVTRESTRIFTLYDHSRPQSPRGFVNCCYNATADQEIVDRLYDKQKATYACAILPPVYTCK